MKRNGRWISKGFPFQRFWLSWIPCWANWDLNGRPDSFYSFLQFSLLVTTTHPPPLKSQIFRGSENQDLIFLPHSYERSFKLDWYFIFNFAIFLLFFFFSSSCEISAISRSDIFFFFFFFLAATFSCLLLHGWNSQTLQPQIARTVSCEPYFFGFG